MLRVYQTVYNDIGKKQTDTVEQGDRDGRRKKPFKKLFYLERRMMLLRVACSFITNGVIVVKIKVANPALFGYSSGLLIDVSREVTSNSFHFQVN